MNKTRVLVAGLFAATAAFSSAANASCATLLSALQGEAGASTAAQKKGFSNFSALQGAVVTAAKATTGGFGLPMWATLMDENGIVCAVVTSPSAQSTESFATWGLDVTAANDKAWSTSLTASSQGSNADTTSASTSQWLGSRVISAQKANTANAFSTGDGTNSYSIATANLYSAVQENGSLYGLQHSNPMNAAILYGTGKNASSLGTAKDPMTGKAPGGVNVFGGGLALYNGKTKVGSIGVSGDTSCRDHAFAWEVRQALSLDENTVGITTANTGADKVSLGTIGTKGDELVFFNQGLAAETNANDGWQGWSHPACPYVETGHASYLHIN